MNTIIEMDAIEFLSQINIQPQMIITDPPYGMNYSSNIPGDIRWNKSGKTTKFDVLRNDKSLDDIDFDAFFKLCFDKSADNSTLFCFCNDKAMVEWASGAVHAGYTWKDTLVWNKKCANGGDIGWPFIHVTEFIIAFTKGKPVFNPLFNADGHLKKRVVNVFDLGRTKKIEHCGHPTQKPMFLCEQLIMTATNKGDMVVDPFCGSGTSLAAAKKLGRHFMGCDIDPKYVSIAAERIEKQNVQGSGSIFSADDI